MFRPVTGRQASLVALLMKRNKFPGIICLIALYDFNFEQLTICGGGIDGIGC